MGTSDFLEAKHVALYLWLYVTGPVMYASLILGTVWFLLMVRNFLKLSETEPQPSTDVT